MNEQNNKLLMEFFGVMILSLSINLSTSYSLGNQLSNWLLVFSGFYTAITWSREISGGHLNPSVTTGFFCAKGENKQLVQAINFILAQILGSCFSCLISFYIYNGNIFNFKINESSNEIQSFLVEVISTFLFVYTILCQSNKSSKLFMEKSSSTLIIALALFASANVAGNISGGCLNPALGIGHNFTRFFIFKDFAEIKYLWIYVLGPLLGGFLASQLYNFFFENYFSGQDNQQLEIDVRM